MNPPPTRLDLRGEVCPYTFLRAKLALEELPPGAEIEILLDHPPAFRNVPQALEEDGHLVLAVEMEERGDRGAPDADPRAPCTVRARKGPA